MPGDDRAPPKTGAFVAAFRRAVARLAVGGAIKSAPRDELAAFEHAFAALAARKKEPSRVAVACPNCRTPDLCGLTGCRGLEDVLQAFGRMQQIHPRPAPVVPESARVQNPPGPPLAPEPLRGAVPDEALPVIELTEDMIVVQPAQAAPAAIGQNAATAPAAELRIVRVANGWIIGEAASPGVSAIGPRTHVATDAGTLAQVVLDLAGPPSGAGAA